MAEHFQSDFEDSHETNEIVERNLKENLYSSEYYDSPDVQRKKNELIPPNESNEFIEYYLTRMNDVNNEILQNSNNKQRIPEEAFKF